MDRELKQKCPVCGTQLRGREYFEGSNLLEAYESCPHRHYNYSFSYGYTEIWIGTYRMSMSYKDSNKKRNMDAHLYKMAVINYQEKHKEELVELLL